MFADDIGDTLDLWQNREEKYILAPLTHNASDNQFGSSWHPAGVRLPNVTVISLT